MGLQLSRNIPRSLVRVRPRPSFSSFSSTDYQPWSPPSSYHIYSKAQSLGAKGLRRLCIIDSKSCTKPFIHKVTNLDLNTCIKMSERTAESHETSYLENQYALFPIFVPQYQCCGSHCHSSRVVDMFDIIKRDVGPLCNWLTSCNPNTHIGQVLIGIRQLRENQRLILCPLRCIR